MESTHDSNSNKRNQTKTIAREHARVDKSELRATYQKDIEEVLRNAKKPAEAQLVLNIKAVVTREDIASLPQPGDLQNPREAHKLYYKTIGRLRYRFIRNNRKVLVPHEARQALNQEIRIFLKQGEPEGDSRMAKTKRMKELVNIFASWMDNYSEGDVAMLYSMVCAENKKLPINKRKR